MNSGTRTSVRGLVTRAQLAAHRGASWYIDRTRLIDEHGYALGVLALTP
ncbi:hypothetical protein [Streptomyces collinus]|nr:hypothetical protein [Streptomyces collinus]UJA11342.1 hypothetical protein HGI10_53190 [Streptomyces collinus]UJA13792.1 hypothetical protein HGI09_10910 [Streptomyces collinus]